MQAVVQATLEQLDLAAERHLVLPLVSPNEQLAFIHGFADRRKGRRKNPFSRGTALHDSWLMGYNAGDPQRRPPRDDPEHP